MPAQSRRVLTLFAASWVLAACSDPLGVEPEIRNIPDSFEFQVSKLSGVSRTLEYSWPTTGAVVNVNQSASLVSGTARLIVFDRNNAQVYNRNLADNGTFTSSVGDAGTWRIRVEFRAASGTVNFRVQKWTG